MWVLRVHPLRTTVPATDEDPVLDLVFVKVQRHNGCPMVLRRALGRGSSLTTRCVYVADTSPDASIEMKHVLIMLLPVPVLLLRSLKPLRYDCLDVVLRLNWTLGLTWTFRVWKTHPRVSTELPACP